MSQTIQQSLIALQQAKEDISAAIVGKGGIVEVGSGFGSFAGGIGTIPSGGGGDTIMYKTYRYYEDGVGNISIRSCWMYLIPVSNEEVPLLILHKKFEDSKWIVIDNTATSYDNGIFKDELGEVIYYRYNYNTNQIVKVDLSAQEIRSILPVDPNGCFLTKPFDSNIYWYDYLTSSSVGLAKSYFPEPEWVEFEVDLLYYNPFSTSLIYKTSGESPDSYIYLATALPSSAVYKTRITTGYFSMFDVNEDWIGVVQYGIDSILQQLVEDSSEYSVLVPFVFCMYGDCEFLVTRLNTTETTDDNSEVEIGEGVWQYYDPATGELHVSDIVYIVGQSLLARIPLQMDEGLMAVLPLFIPYPEPQLNLWTIDYQFEPEPEPEPEEEVE